MKKGFTLIELLGVIVILGLIIAVAVPSLIESNKQAKLNEQQDFINTLELAAKDYINFYSDPSEWCSTTDTEGNDDPTCVLSRTYENLYKQENNSDNNVEITTTMLTYNDKFLKKSLIDPFTKNKVDNENITITMVNNNGKLKATKITIIKSNGEALEKDIPNE